MTAVAYVLIVVLVALPFVLAGFLLYHQWKHGSLRHVRRTLRVLYMDMRDETYWWQSCC